MQTIFVCGNKFCGKIEILIKLKIEVKIKLFEKH